jgi:hypothetical protein
VTNPGKLLWQQQQRRPSHKNIYTFYLQEKSVKGTILSSQTRVVNNAGEQTDAKWSLSINNFSMPAS